MMHPRKSPYFLSKGGMNFLFRKKFKTSELIYY